MIDHAAKPDIANGGLNPWADHMARLARETPWYCKVSGLVTEARADWRIDDLRPYVDHLPATFGPARLMRGSDWPVGTLASGYRRRRDAAATLLPAAAHDAVFGGTAVRFCGLSDCRAYSAAALRVVRRASHSCMAVSMVMNTAPPSISFWIRRSSIIMRWPRPMTCGWKV